MEIQYKTWILAVIMNLLLTGILLIIIGMELLVSLLIASILTIAIAIHVYLENKIENLQEWKEELE